MSGPIGETSMVAVSELVGAGHCPVVSMAAHGWNAIISRD